MAIRLTPRSAKEGLGGIWRDDKDASWLQAQVRAIPEKGQANRALIRIIAKRLSVPAKDIEIESGDTSRLKRLRLVGWAASADRIVKELDGS